VTPAPRDSARRTRAISAHDIELFTELTGDRNPLHYDAEAAAASRFGGIIVQGGVTTGLLTEAVSPAAQATESARADPVARERP
jgi:acyl dehydratase